jgi:hypothetical protein
MDAGMPLVRYLQKNYDPHTMVLVTSNSIEVLVEAFGIPNLEEHGN